MVDERKKYQVFSYVCEQKKVEQQNLKAQVDDQWIDSIQERKKEWWIILVEFISIFVGTYFESTSSNRHAVPRY